MKSQLRQIFMDEVNEIGMPVALQHVEQTFVMGRGGGYVERVGSGACNNEHMDISPQMGNKTKGPPKQSSVSMQFFVPRV